MSIRVDNQPSQTKPVAHIVGMIATGVGAATFTKVTGIWDVVSKLQFNPLSIFSKSAVDEATQTSTLEKAQETKQKIERLQGILTEKTTEAAARTAEKNAAEALVATAKTKAEAAHAALDSNNVDFNKQTNSLTTFTARCTDRATLSQAVVDANSKLGEATSNLQAAKQALENAKNSAATAATDATKKAAENLVNSAQASITAAETLEKSAQGFVNEKTAALSAFDTKIQGEAIANIVTKEVCDTEIPAITAKITELTQQGPKLGAANTTAFEALEKATTDLSSKAGFATAATEEAAKAAKEHSDAVYEGSLRKSIDENVSGSWDWVKKTVSDLTTCGKELALENKEFLTATVGFTGTYYVVDLLASKHIKNSYARGAFSFATAFVVVWTGSNFGFKNDMHVTTTLAYGAVTIGATKLAIHVAPLLQQGLGLLYRGIGWVGDRKMTYTRE